MEFASKAYFLLLLLLIPYILWYFLGRKKSEPTMRMSDTRIYQYAPKSMRVRLIHLPMVLRCICFVLIVIAMARPQTHYSWDNKTVEGIDIMLAMDVSTSMLAEDLKPNRMEAELLSGVTVTDETSLYRAADTLLAAGLQRVFLSLGADGVLAADHERKIHLHNLPARMVNTTGCGDAFMAAVARAFLDGADLETAAKRGLAASAIAMESADTINPAMSLTAVAERIQ